MIYPESQYKVYSGKLISVEMELDKIESRNDMASFIILIAALFATISLIFRLLETGFSSPEDIITIITIVLYIFLWLISYEAPLVCFISALIIYGSNLWLNYDQLFTGWNSRTIFYQLTVPIILLVGIGNVFYGWYQLNQIKIKEAKFPEYIKILIYVIKDTFIYNDIRFFDVILNNVDNSEEIDEGLFLLTLNNKDQYLNYSIMHNTYGKLCQVYVKVPVASMEDVVDKMLQETKYSDIHIYLSILMIVYKEKLDWVECFIKQSGGLDDNNLEIKNIVNFIISKSILSLSDKKSVLKLETYKKKLNRIQS